MKMMQNSHFVSNNTYIDVLFSKFTFLVFISLSKPCEVTYEKHRGTIYYYDSCINNRGVKFY